MALGAARGNVIWMVMLEVLLLVARAAGDVPALRASRLDPMAALRYE